MPLQMRSPYFFALDVDSDTKAMELARLTSPHVGGFKVGPRLSYRYGAGFIQQLSQLAPVFVDNKYHDIPSTMLAALQASFDAGASFATIHSSSGKTAMRAVAKLEKELNEKRPFRILAVTVLTSFDEQNLPSNWRPQSIDAHVQALVSDAYEAGIRGIVCSPHEVSAVKKKYPDLFTVVPGIRLQDDIEVKNEDQARVATATEALRSGASALVIGRALLSSHNPGQQAEKIAQSLKQT